MSIQQVGNKTYANISDLPQIQNISDGDYLIVHTTDGTCVIDYCNFIVDLAHTTFQDTFTEMSEFVSTANEFVTTMTDSFTDLQESFTKVESRINTLEAEMEAVRLLIKLICTGAKNSSSLVETVNQLSTDAKSIYEDIFSSIQSNNNGAGFSFTESYLTAGV